MADGRLRVGGYASGDRYPGYYLLWTGLLLAAGLFHRSTDPDETHNLIAELPDVAASARARRHLPQSRRRRPMLRLSRTCALWGTSAEPGVT